MIEIKQNGTRINFPVTYNIKPTVIACNNQYNNRIISAIDITIEKVDLKMRSGGDAAISGYGNWFAIGF